MTRHRWIVLAVTVAVILPLGMLLGFWAGTRAQADGRCRSPADSTGGDSDTHFLGTDDEQPLELRVNNAPALRLEPRAVAPNLVGGYFGNSIGELPRDE